MSAVSRSLSLVFPRSAITPRGRSSNDRVNRVALQKLGAWLSNHIDGDNDR